MLCEATLERAVLAASCWRSLREQASSSGQHGTLAGMRTAAFRRTVGRRDACEMSPTVHGGEQSNTSATIRRAVHSEAVSPRDAGSQSGLRDWPAAHRAGDRCRTCPTWPARSNIATQAGRQMTVAILHEFVPNVGDAWTYTLDELGRYFERVQSRTPEPALSRRRSAAYGGTVRDQYARRHRAQLESCRADVANAGTLDGVVAARAAAARAGHDRRLSCTRPSCWAAAPPSCTWRWPTSDGGPAFSPEPFTRLYQRSLYQSMRSQARTTLELLRVAVPQAG